MWHGEKQREQKEVHISATLDSLISSCSLMKVETRVQRGEINFCSAHSMNAPSL